MRSYFQNSASIFAFLFGILLSVSCVSQARGQGAASVAGPFEKQVGPQLPTWWSFKAPIKPPVPDSRPSKIQNPKPKTQNPIDLFLLAKLQIKGLSFSPPADRRALIRRAYLDLIGLPPTPEEVRAFVGDRSANAWGNVVDRLLASPLYGERWGRHWLDVVRYADSGGFEGDRDRPYSWRYRDYVIDSFNSDLP